MNETVLVTGSAGFIGSAVEKALSEAGYDVRAGVRNTARPQRPGVVTVPCDLDRPEQVRLAVQGADAVVHCAYGDAAAMPRQCAALLDAMSAAGVTRLVHFSSIAVYGDAPMPDADAPIAGAALEGDYAKGKGVCEKLVRDWVGSDPQRRVMILRPGIVYGAGSPFWIEKLSRRIEAGMWGDFGAAGEAPVPLVHVDDVAEAACAALAKSTQMRARIETVDLVGPQTPTWNAYAQAVANALSAGPLPRVGPVRLAWWRLLALPAKAWRRLGLPGFARASLAPGAGELRVMARSATYDMDRTARLLGKAPAIGLGEGIRRSFADQETRPDP